VISKIIFKRRRRTKEDLTVTALTETDYSLILEALRYQKDQFTSYDRYPNDEFRRSRIADVDAVIAKVKALRASSHA
jgi:hypothetical protein